MMPPAGGVLNHIRAPRELMACANRGGAIRGSEAGRIRGGFSATQGAAPDGSRVWRFESVGIYLLAA